MMILIIYYKDYNSEHRNTIDEHLYAFRRYSGEECFYLNAAAGVPSFLERLHFDLIIYHYTICGCKWYPPDFRRFQKKWEPLKNISGYKVALPQDEYVHSEDVCSFFKEFGIKTIFTCLPSSEWQKVYPTEKSGVEDFVTVFTGYVDEEAIDKIEKFVSRPRDIDVGYRARKVPFWLGSHGCIKWRLTEVFLNAVKERNLKVDISNDPNDVFLGDDWYKFLSRCRVVLGCEGGASLHDPDGSIRQRVDEYTSRNPAASFEEVEKVCFPGLDGNLRLFALSPRHFECCITRTCQVLVEGEYAGIFKPGVHYIELKKDWSNLDEVINKIQDHDYCRKIADNAYRDIVASGLYTYRKSVTSIIEHCRPFMASGTSPDTDPRLLRRLEWRERNGKLLLLPSALLLSAMKMLYAVLGLFGLLGTYNRIMASIRRKLR